jgi:integrase
MPKKRSSLTTAFIEKATPKHPKAPTLYGDGNGLYFQVTRGGGRSWIFRYTISGKTRSMGLGALRDVGLKEARAHAIQLCAKIGDGIDPLEERRRQKGTGRAVELSSDAEGLVLPQSQRTPTEHTFRECANTYLARRTATLKSRKHAAQWRNTIEQYALPTLGGKGMVEIGVQDVLDVLEPIWTRIPETAGRLRGRIEKIFAYAAVLGYRPKELGNPAAWAGLLSEVLPPRSRVRSVKHHSSLPYQEMPQFFATLRDDGSMGSVLLQFIILTMTRTGEARGARWEEVHLNERLWVIPGIRMKSGKQHRVPLSDAALDILRHQSRTNQTLAIRSEFVFPGRNPEKPLSDAAALELLKRMRRSDITPHGMRSTARVFAAEQTTYSREVCEAALAHQVRDRVEASYQRSDLLEKRRGLMDTWAAHCTRLLLKA